MATTNFTLQIDEEEGKKFERFCEKEGLNATSALDMFVRTVIIMGKMPFSVAATENADNTGNPEESDWQAKMEFMQKSIVPPHEMPILMDEKRQIIGARMLENVREIQEQSVLNGTSEMTMDEINAEIAAYRKEEREKLAAMAEMGETVKSLQEQSVLNGTSEMTMDEINAEIAAYRKENREKSALLAELRANNPLRKQSELRDISKMLLQEIDAEIAEYNAHG
ncbi:MAG: hypothetical protein FWG68_08255 [Defluviitaleaceae bacterium]|nr:hypothetical protein [Defluviitaleaceae bacterium]